MESESPRPTAELVRSLRERADGKTISLGDVAEALQGRPYGLLLLVLAIPELIPMIGTSAILATPIFVIGVYMLWHGTESALPRWLERRSIKRSRLDKAIDKTLPMLERLDRISKPRWMRLARFTRLQGVVCIVMAILLAVPIPGINIMSAFAVAGTGVAIMQRDGLVLAAACVLALLATAATVLVVTLGIGLLR